METVQVYIRLRANEKGDLAPWRINPTSIALEGTPHSYSFDYVFSSEAGQGDLFRVAGKPLLGNL
jgi:hypothetical protein